MANPAEVDWGIDDPVADWGHDDPVYIASHKRREILGPLTPPPLSRGAIGEYLDGGVFKSQRQPTYDDVSERVHNTAIDAQKASDADPGSFPKRLRSSGAGVQSDLYAVIDADLWQRELDQEAAFAGEMREKAARRKAAYQRQFGKTGGAVVDKAVTGLWAIGDGLSVGGMSSGLSAAERKLNDIPEDELTGAQKVRASMREDSPILYSSGEIGASFVPSAKAWNAVDWMARKIPGVKKVQATIDNAGRLPAYTRRMVVEGGKSSGLAYPIGAGLVANAEEDVSGRPLSIEDRNNIGVGLAKSPWSWATPAGLSAINRGMNFVKTGGHTATPRRVQAEVYNDIGRAPTKKEYSPAVTESAALIQAGNRLAPKGQQEPDIIPVRSADDPPPQQPDPLEGLDVRTAGLGGAGDGGPPPGRPAGTDPVSANSIKVTEYITAALKNSGLDDDRIRVGFENINRAMRENADGRTPYAVMLEREFARDVPDGVLDQIQSNFRRFLLKVGLDNSGATTGKIDRARTENSRYLQEDVFPGTFGEPPRYRTGQELTTAMSDVIGEGYNRVLDTFDARASFAGLEAESVLTQTRAQLRARLLASPSTEALLGQQAYRRGFRTADGQPDVEAYINAQPANAAHTYRAGLRKRMERASAGEDLDRLSVAQDNIDRLLANVPGYSQQRQRYAELAGQRDILGWTELMPNGKEVRHPGFGERLKKASRSKSETDRLVEEYQAMSPEEQAYAMLSIRDVFTDQFRGARPSGTNARGEDVYGMRLSDLHTTGFVDDALPAIMPERGGAVREATNDTIFLRQFFADIDPRTGSNTVNKANAQADGADAMVSGLPRLKATTGSSTRANMSDALLLANGMPPIQFLMNSSGIGSAISRIGMPNQEMRESIATTLLRRPESARTFSPPNQPDIPGPRNTARPKQRKEYRPVKSPSEAGFNRNHLIGAGLVTAGAGMGMQREAEAQEVSANEAELERVQRLVTEIEEQKIPKIDADIARLTEIATNPPLKGSLEAFAAQREMKAMGMDLGNYGPKEDGIDGDIGKDSQDAIQAYIAKLEAEKTAQRGELRTQRGTLETLKMRAAQDEAQQDGGMFGWKDWLPNAVAVGGALLAARNRRGSLKFNNARTAQTQALMEGLLEPPRGWRPPSQAHRAGQLNEFAKVGGAPSHKLPITVDPQTGQLSGNPKALPMNKLNNKNNFVRREDFAGVIAGAAGAGLSMPVVWYYEGQVRDAQERRDAARDRGDDAGYQKALEDLRRAETSLTLALAVQRGSMGLGIGAGLGVGAGRYNQGRPANINIAQKMQADLLQELAPTPIAVQVPPKVALRPPETQSATVEEARPALEMPKTTPPAVSSQQRNDAAEAARLARGRGMGYDLDEPVYVVQDGSKRPNKEGVLLPGMGNAVKPKFSDPRLKDVVVVTSTPEEALFLAQREQPPVGTKGLSSLEEPDQLRPVVRRGEILELSASRISDESSLEQVVGDAFDQGFPIVRLINEDTGQFTEFVKDTRFLADPKRAKFKPTNKTGEITEKDPRSIYAGIPLLIGAGGAALALGDRERGNAPEQ